MGDVTDIRLQVTHVRTPKNEEVVIPNSTILNGEVVNYSTLARRSGLILHTTVGIGYETPWRQVEAMLLHGRRAHRRACCASRRRSCSRQALGDFCVTYELNVYCDRPQAMAQLYTELHRNDPRRLQRVRRADHDPGLRGRPAAAEGRAQGPVVHGAGSLSAGGLGT